ncbi:general transcription factor IIH subunit 3-like protein [Leptotrombidium deliense]|uniref:General transcription factor IIH subunit 3 n=1 Tax=Leptotrombidium deliense TaxID=299467 RepID=A0A443SWR4_9ACAR|nr:general transcription factor IIH subunit 3-like protein [Leptotrombidium deliense]
MDAEQSSHLVVIIDILPKSSLILDDNSVYEKWLNAIVSFCNSHLLLNANNKLTVISTSFDENNIVYPRDKDEKEQAPFPGQYPLFSTVTRVICNQLKLLASRSRQAYDNNEHIQSLQSLMAGAIGIGLLKINKLKSEVDGSRIAIVTACDDGSTSFYSQHMNFMNVFFTAQKMNVVIDACVAIGNHSDQEYMGMSILKQGCDLTGGLYLRISNVSAFLEYLLWTLLPDVETRKKLLLPTQKRVSYKAACFCHRNLIDIGFVCSVCLSIQFVQHVSKTNFKFPLTSLKPKRKPLKK